MVDNNAQYENDSTTSEDVNQLAVKKPRGRPRKEEAYPVQHEAQEEILESSQGYLSDDDAEEDAEDDNYRSSERRRAPSHPARGSVNRTESIHEKRPEAHTAALSRLPTPKARKGMVQRWIRVNIPHSSDHDENNYYYMRMRGWTPRPLDTVSEGFFPPTLKDGRFSGVIRVGEMVLCEMPEAQYQRNRQATAEKTLKQTSGIDHRLLKEQKPNNAFGPFQRERKVTATRGRRPVEIADD